MKSIKTTALLVAVAALLTMVTACNRPSSDNGGWPDKPEHRVVLKPFEKGEAIRYATYWPDGLTIKEYQIEYRNGMTTYQEFRQDGTLAAMKELYPGDGQRQLKDLRYFAADGKTTTLRTAYRQNGSLEITGKRLSNGMAEQLYYDADGKVPVRYQVVSAEGKDIHSQTIVAGVTPVSVPVADGLQITTYRPNGLRESIEVLRPNGFEDIDFFALDGVTLKMTVRIGYDIGAAYYDDDGTTVSSWRKFTADGDMEVTFYRDCTADEVATWPAPASTFLDSLPSSKLTGCKAVDYVQTWSVDSTTRDDGSEIPFADRTYKLSSVEVKGADGKTERSYHFEDGRFVESRQYEDGTAKRSKRYREDGTLESINELYYWGGTSSTEYVDASKNIRESVPARLKKPIPFADPRPFVKAPVEPPPPPPYYWGDGF